MNKESELNSQTPKDKIEIPEHTDETHGLEAYDKLSDAIGIVRRDIGRLKMARDEITKDTEDAMVKNKFELGKNLKYAERLKARLEKHMEDGKAIDDDFVRNEKERDKILMQIKKLSRNIDHFTEIIASGHTGA